MTLPIGSTIVGSMLRVYSHDWALSSNERWWPGHDPAAAEEVPRAVLLSQSEACGGLPGHTVQAQAAIQSLVAAQEECHATR